MTEEELEDQRQLLSFRINELRRFVAERASRRVEALKLYEPLAEAALFHASAVPERLIRGSNRAGKTLAAAVEVARAVTGQDPHGKYPLENGRAYLVGKDGKHLGEVLYRKLFRAGAFKIVKDATTRQWRALRPWEDTAKIGDIKQAPPLIPARFVKTVAWESKKENIPKVIVLKNGWEMSFYSSLAKPPQGSDVDLAIFDEEIVDPDWYPEIGARLLDRGGRFIWSATPQAGTQHLYDLHERCADQLTSIDPICKEFVMLLADNKHMSEKQKQQFIAKLDEDQRAVRVQGEFAVTSYKVYPEFSKEVHLEPYREIPGHWTRYMVVDPGHQYCAVLFAAVAPGSEGGHVWFYDELYLRGCDASIFAERVRHKTQGQVFQEFIIDWRGSRITQIGAGKTTKQQYSEELRKRGVSSIVTKSSFIDGSDDVKAGIDSFRKWLRPDVNGFVKLKVIGDKTPFFQNEIKRYHYKRDSRGFPTDDPEERWYSHLMACCRYLAMRDPKWRSAPKADALINPVVTAARELRKKLQRTAGNIGSGG